MDQIFHPLDQQVTQISQNTGQSELTVKILLTYISAIFICLVFRLPYLPRHLYAIVSGSAIYLFLWRYDVLHFVFVIVVTKIMMHVLPRHKQHWVIFIFNFVYFLGILLYRSFYWNDEFDFTYYSAILCQKMSSLGFCYRDGLPSFKGKLTPNKEHCKLSKIPSFIELFSYSAYPGSSVIGPFFEFKDYINFIELKDRYASIPFSFSRLGASLFYAFGSLVCSILIDMFTRPLLKNIYINDYLSSDLFRNDPLYMKYIIWVIATQNFKLKGYVSWFFGECGNVCSGFAYSGKDKDGKDKFEYLRVYLWEFELSTNIRDIMNYWNFHTTSYFRHYVYEPIYEGDKKYQNIATFATFIYSALWHGFFWGYYIFFVLWYMLTSIARKMWLLIDYPSSKLSSIFGWLMTFSIMYFNCGVYLALELSSVLKFWESFHYVPQLAIIVGFVLSNMIPSSWIKDKKQTQGNEKAAKVKTK